MKLSLRDARGVSIGIEFVVSVMLGLGAGAWCDRRFHTTPWLTLLGIAIGTAAGFRSLMRMAKSPRTTKRAPDEYTPDGRAHGHDASMIEREREREQSRGPDAPGGT